MNVFELSLVATPLAGLLAGTSAVAGRNVAVTVTGAMCGMAVGLATYFVPTIVSMALLDRATRRSQHPQQCNSWAFRAVGAVIVFYVIASPIVAWFLTGFAFHLLGLAP